MTFAEKIQSLRKQRNISQEQLADMMNVTRQAVSKWEQGESLPDVDNIVRLSEMLDVSLDYLLKDYPETTEPSMADVLDSHEDTPGRIMFNFEAAIYPLATLAYLVMGFHWGLWHPGWLIFVAAWVVEELVAFAKTGKGHISFYSLSGVVFLIVGFVFGLWRYAWLVFIVAWLLDELIVRKPRKKKKKHDENINTANG